MASLPASINARAAAKYLSSTAFGRIKLRDNHGLSLVHQTKETGFNGPFSICNSGSVPIAALVSTGGASIRRWPAPPRECARGRRRSTPNQYLGQRILCRVGEILGRRIVKKASVMIGVTCIGKALIGNSSGIRRKMCVMALGPVTQLTR
jgi:hypothetical protein